MIRNRVGRVVATRNWLVKEAIVHVAHMATSAPTHNATRRASHGPATHAFTFSASRSSATRSRLPDSCVADFTAFKVSSCVRWSKLTIRRYQNTRRLSKRAVQLRSMRTPLDISLDVLRRRFEATTEGDPALVIDESCRILCDALSGGYHMDPNGTKPIKDNEYDHLVDCLRYGVWFLFGVNATANTNRVLTSVRYNRNAARAAEEDDDE